MIRYSKKIFDEQIKHFGEEVQIDGVKGIGLIANDLNQYDENNEDRKLKIENTINIERGSYVKYGENNYLVVSNVDKNDVSKTCKIRQCQQMLKWRDKNGIIKEYPCTLESSSFGSDESAGGFFIVLDEKVKIQVQFNNDTKNIELGYRFIFNNSKHGVFKISNVNNSVKQGVLTLVAEKDSVVVEDDIQNNLAFNGTVTPPTPTTYTITGSPTIRVNTSTTYTLTPSTTNVTWEVDSPTIATITAQDTNTCTVKALVVDEIVILIAKQNGVKLKELVIETMR